MTITIINQPTNNRGDEAAHRSLIRSLNYSLPECKIKVLFVGESSNTVQQMAVVNTNNIYISIPKKKGMAQFFPKFFTKYKLLGLANIFKGYALYKKELGDSDYIICAPGGICMGGFQHWAHLFYLLYALDTKKKVFYYSRSIGPFPVLTKDNILFKKRSIEILKRLDFISLRDSKSIEIAKDFGVKFSNSIDTAFLDVPDVTLPLNLEEITNGKYIVFVPNSLTWHHAYKNVKQEIIDNLYISIAQYILNKDLSIKIIMLPQIFNDSEVCDERYFKSLKLRINNSRVVVLSEDFSSDVQQKIISNANLVIGARYHSVVFAINNNVSFLALAYEHKMTGLLDMLNLSDRSVDLTKYATSFDDEHLLESVCKLADTTIEPHRINNANVVAKSLAKNCFLEVLDQLN